MFKTITINIKGMHCNSCKMLIEDALEDLGTKQAEVDMKTKTITITYNKDELDLNKIIETIKAEGYSIIKQ